MRIIIEEPKTEFAASIYQSGRERYTTLTDVKYISPNRIIAAHRYACKVYLIQIDDFETNKYTILHTLTLTHMGKKMQTEMMDVYYNTIFLICYNEMMFVLDILPNDTLAIRKAIQLTPNRIPHHGIRVHGEYVYITPSNMKIGYEHIVQYHIHSGAIRYLPSIGPNIRIKNIAFTQNEHAVMAINYKTETNMSMKNHTSHGALQLYAPNMQCIQSIKYPATHFDSICMAPRASQDDPEIFYAIGADGEGGYIYKGIIENNQIIGVKKYPCMDFPHGIDVHDNKIVYTSYATSSIEWIDINELD